MSAAACRKTPDDLAVQPRNLRFVDEAAGSGAGRFWANGDPVATHYHNALSLTFPEGERFFVDAVKAFRHLADGRLAAEVQAFIVQEHLHSREHAVLNRLLDPAHYPIAAIEAFIARRIRIGRSRPPVVQLVVTTVLEHFTAILADDLLRHPEDLSGAPEDIRRLWLWHALEETEHKAVAFEVMERATQGWSDLYRYTVRVRAMLLISLAFNISIVTITLKLLKADGITGWSARWRLLKFLASARGPFRRTAGKWAAWFRPGFHPWQDDNRALLARFRPLFAAAQTQVASAAAE